VQPGVSVQDLVLDQIFQIHQLATLLGEELQDSVVDYLFPHGRTQLNTRPLTHLPRHLGQRDASYQPVMVGELDAGYIHSHESDALAQPLPVLSLQLPVALIGNDDELPRPTRQTSPVQW